MIFLGKKHVIFQCVPPGWEKNPNIVITLASPSLADEVFADDTHST